MNEHAGRDKRDVRRMAFVAPQEKEPRVYPWVSIYGGAIASAVFGGTVFELAGGKFANGVFNRLFE